MKKFITPLLLLVALGVAKGQAWEPVGLTTAYNEPWTALGLHQGALYAHNATLGLVKSTDNGDNWTPISTAGVVGNIHLITSTGSRLYVASTMSGGTGDIYWTDNDGGAWHSDTVGMPPHVLWPQTNKAGVNQLHGFNGKLALDADNADAYYVKNETDASWTHVPWLAANDPGAFSSHGDTLFTAGGGTESHGFAYTTDLGNTWTTPDCNGIPQWHAIGLLDRDPTNGRWYLSGTDVTTQERFVKYSTDQGASWTSINTAPYLVHEPGIWGFAHAVGAMFTRGNTIWLSCQNQHMGTRPDLFLSTDGGQTFAKDTVGLPEDPYATFAVYNFVELNGYVFAQFSGTDVYRKQLGTTSIQDLSSLAQFSVAPNPASDQVRLLNIDPAGTEYRIVNALGATVGQGRLPMDRTIHLGGLEPGVYHISLLKGGKPVGVQRVVKS